MKKVKLFLFLFVLGFSLIYSLEKRPSFKPMTTSVIIPCHYLHAHYLPQLIKAYAEGTVLPDEIVISLSEAKKVEKKIIDEINDTKWPFPVNLLTFDYPITAGGNRNKACMQASGDILIGQDADDLPHPQRVEIIKYFFENYQLDHLMHGWLEDKAPIQVIKNFDEIGIIESSYYRPEFGGGTYCNGPIAITKEVFNTVQWTDRLVGEDVMYNHNIYSRFSHKVVLKAPIYVYRHRLSSYHILKIYQ